MQVTDAAIHRVSGYGENPLPLFACWFTVDHHGLSALAMTKDGKDSSEQATLRFLLENNSVSHPP